MSYLNNLKSTLNGSCVIFEAITGKAAVMGAGLAGTTAAGGYIASSPEAREKIANTYNDMTKSISNKWNSWTNNPSAEEKSITSNSQPAATTQPATQPATASSAEEKSITSNSQPAATTQPMKTTNYQGETRQLPNNPKLNQSVMNDPNKEQSITSNPGQIAGTNGILDSSVKPIQGVPRDQFDTMGSVTV